MILNHMKTLLVKFIILFSFSFCVFAGSFKAKIELSPAGSFVAEGKIRGKIKKEGDFFTAKKLYSKVSGIKTGIELRDKHLKEKLKYKELPKITLTDVKGKDGKGSGTLSLNGVSKKVKFLYKVKGELIKAQLDIKLSSFQIKGIKYMGVGVDDNLRIIISQKFK